ncbi:hypothetical protein E1295_32280 [Nonomuraea mesophila]|uniref:OmpR/PhoB-type domain-containing protein n=1 Tax=Nonomuraea mesophila TaxID=2530382 RepID=A0A4V2Z8D2_9ACTN|nr:hypothetical protein [Nonomuraea mesophila]TDE39956.1 hypothetical protein E1295_32280 [Nonomuraea mesophila]
MRHAIVRCAPQFRSQEFLQPASSSLLGAVTGERKTEPIEFGPARQQVTLALLASALARPVPMHRLVSGIWGDDAPRNAEQSVYTYISGLCRTLEPSRLLPGTSAGYVLHLGPGQVDAVLFGERVAQAHQEEWRRVPSRAGPCL